VVTPYDEADPNNDPMELVAVSLPSEADSRLEMAYVFAEEFARLGHDGPRILRMFQNAFYAGPNAAYRALGHERTVAIIDECLAVWGRVRPVDVEPPPGGDEPD
jgi:hypothetical protein